MTIYLFCGVAYNVWRADVRALVDGLQANRLDRFALRRFYEGAEEAVIGEAVLEAALAPIETGVEENEERWEFVDRELLGAHDQTRDVLSDVWDDASDAEHLLPWLGEVRAQGARVMRSSSVVHELRRASGDDATLAAFAAAVDAAAPWLSSWLAPHVAGAYVQVAPASEPLKPADALLAFDMVVVRALGGIETVDTVRKKLHGAAQTPKEAPHASAALSASTKVANASSFSHALKRASRRMLGQPDPSTYAFVKHASPPRCSRYAVLAIRAKALALQADDAMATLAKEAMDNDAGRAITDRGSVGTAAEQPGLVADALDAYVKTLGGAALRDCVDADALPEILHAMASGAFAAFKSALEAIVAAVPGSSLMGDCDPRTAVKSSARIRAKLQEYRAEEQKWPACARVQDPLRATILCSSSAVMLEALKKVEAPPFKLLRLKNNLASEKKPFKLHAVLDFAPPDAKVPLVVEVQLLFDHLLPLFAHTHVLYSVYRCRSFDARNAATPPSAQND